MGTLILGVPALPAARAAEPAPRKVRKRLLVRPVGADSRRRSRFSLFIRTTSGYFATCSPFSLLLTAPMLGIVPLFKVLCP
jgi:hypothetical protein